MAPTRKGGTAKRGRPKGTAAPLPKQTTGEAKQRVAKDAPRGQKARTRAQAEDTAAPSSNIASRAKPAQSRRRSTQGRTADDGNAPAARPASKAARYSYLTPKVKRIPEETIEKWPVIAPPVLEQISAVLKRARDIIAWTRRDPQKQREAEETLNKIIPHLEGYFSTTKVPPQAKAYHFDLDYLTSLNERIYADLTTARHRNQMLEDQIEKAGVRLKDEEDTLKKYKENAQQWRKRWQSQEKQQLHPLVQETEEAGTNDDKPSDIGLRKNPQARDTTLLDTPDADLAPLLEEFRRALKTMQGNQDHVDGIDEAVQHARGALDDILFRHASARQYDAL